MPEKAGQRRKTRADLPVLIGLAVIVAVAAVLRFWALKWGLPNALHDYTYHPDESFQVRSMLSILSTGLDPGFYNYPSGYMNLGALAIKIANGYGMPMENLYAPYLVARVLVAAMGALTVPVVFGIGNRLFGRAVGLLAAAIFALMPLHIVHSHFASVDVPATLWVAAAMLLAAAIYTRPTLSIYIAAGAAAGFAAGTKYNAALVIVPVVVAHFLRQDGSRPLDRVKDSRLWFALVSCVLAFFVATPGWLVWPDRFIGDANSGSGLLYELHHAATGHGFVFIDRGPGWFDILTNSIGYGLGVFLLVMSMCAVGYALLRRTRADWILLSFLVPYFVMIALSEVRFTRYALPMLPVLAVLVSRMMVGVHTVLVEQEAKFLRWVWVVGCGVVLVYTGVYAAAFLSLFSQPDPREVALHWFEENARPGATVGLPTVPWFYSPPFVPAIVGMPSRMDRYQAMSQSSFRLVTELTREWDPRVITENHPDFVVTSDYEYEDPQRLKLRDYEQFAHELNKNYDDAAVFHKNFSAFGVDFGPTECLPHDMRYMAPTIRVYRNRR